MNPFPPGHMVQVFRRTDGKPIRKALVEVSVSDELTGATKKAMLNNVIVRLTEKFPAMNKAARKAMAKQIIDKEIAMRKALPKPTPAPLTKEQCAGCIAVACGTDAEAHTCVVNCTVPVAGFTLNSEVSR